MEKNIVIKEYNISDYDNTFLNNSNDECFICYSNDNQLILMNNQFCNCFSNVIICEECFIKWLFQNCKCFICRKKFTDQNNNKFNIFRIYINNIFLKILIKIEELYINNPTNDNIHIDRTTRNNIVIDDNTINYYRINIDKYKWFLNFFLKFTIIFFFLFSLINYIYYIT